MIKERHRVKNITDRVMAVHSWQIQDVVRQEPNASASTRGWGAVYGAQTNGHLYSLDEQTFHINYLELKAVLSGLKSCLAMFIENT